MRLTPYTERGLPRVPCAHCGTPSAYQWRLDACAAGKGRWLGLCGPCDLELNALVLRFVRQPDAEQLLAAYASRT